MKPSERIKIVRKQVLDGYDHKLADEQNNVANTAMISEICAILDEFYLEITKK